MGRTAMLIHQFEALFGIGTGIVRRWKGLAENSADQLPINSVDPRFRFYTQNLLHITA